MVFTGKGNWGQILKLDDAHTALPYFLQLDIGTKFRIIYTKEEI